MEAGRASALHPVLAGAAERKSHTGTSRCHYLAFIRHHFGPCLNSIKIALAKSSFGTSRRGKFFRVPIFDYVTKARISLAPMGVWR